MKSGIEKKEKTPSGSGKENRLLGFLKEKTRNSTFSLVIAIVILYVILSILSPYFFTWNNIVNIGTAASISGIMAAGLTVAMILGALDISQYSVAALTGVFLAIFAGHGVPVFWVLVLSLLVGVVCGAINGFIVSVLKVNSIIATLGTMMIFRGCAYLLTSGSTFVIKVEFYQKMARGSLMGLPNVVWLMAVVFFGAAYILKYTAFGRKVFAVGGNETATYLSGINIHRIRFVTLILSGLSASIGGILITSQISSAIPQAGLGSELDGIAAVVLGGISLSGGKGKVSGTFLGILFLMTIANGFTLLGVESYYQTVIKGIVLILAVAIDSARNRLSRNAA